MTQKILSIDIIFLLYVPVKIVIIKTMNKKPYTQHFSFILTFIIIQQEAFSIIDLNNILQFGPM